MSARIIDQDLVSIITPAYKASAFIDETIASVVAQTYPHWELLVAEDCSPDDTREKVAKWAAKDPRVKLMALPVNGGPAAARNAALAASSGRWIAFLDSDDLWTADKLQRQMAFHKASGSAITFTGFRRVTAHDSVAGRYIKPPTWLDYRRALGLTGIATSTVLLDRSVTGDVRMKPVYYDDFACWLDVLRGGGRGYGLDADLMRYRVLAGSISRNKLRSAKEVWRQLRAVECAPLPIAVPAFASYALHAAIKYSRF